MLDFDRFICKEMRNFPDFMPFSISRGVFEVWSGRMSVAPNMDGVDCVTVLPPAT